MRFDPRTQKTLKTSDKPHRTITCRDYSKYNHEELSRDIENHDWNNFYSMNNVNFAWNYLRQTFTSIIDRHAPLVKKRIKGRLWSTYKRLKNLCNNKVKQAKQTYNKDLLNENSRNPAKFWKCIKDIFPSKETMPIGATTSSDNNKNTETANSYYNFFTNVAQSLKSKTFRLRDFTWEKPPSQAYRKKHSTSVTLVESLSRNNLSL